MATATVGTFEYNDAQIEILSAQVIVCDITDSPLAERIEARRNLFAFLTLCYESVRVTHPESLEVLMGRARSAWDELATLVTSEETDETTPLVVETFECVENLLSIHATATAAAAAADTAASADTTTFTDTAASPDTALIAAS
jgi:hypothetical protein